MNKLVDGDLLIDTASRQAFLKGEIIPLASKEFELLKILVQNKGRAMQKEKLFNMVWGVESFSENSTLTVHINKLREKIEINPREPKAIMTVWGVGYRFEGMI